MTAENKKIKFISGIVLILIIIPTVLFSTPKKANAQAAVTDVTGIPLQIPQIGSGATGAAAGVANAGSDASTALIQGKEWYKQILNQVLMAIARKALQEITKSTVNWINGGFHGAPLFLENPSSFFQDIGKSEVKTLVNEFGYDPAKFPFGKAFALNTINAYNRTLDNNAAYTLSQVIKDPVLLSNYQNNFNTGGWNGFFMNTQYPQNNYLGFQMLATDQLAQQLQGTTQNAAQTVQTALQQGNGFLSPQTCPSNPAYDKIMANEFQRPTFDEAGYQKDNPYNPQCGDPGSCNFVGPVTDPAAQQAACSTYNSCISNYNIEYQGQEQDSKNAWAQDNTCPGGLKNTTPGSVVSSQITTALNIPANSTLQAMGLGNSLSAIFDALLNHFLGEGLSALSSTVNPPPQDNFSYNGLTLGGPSDNTTDAFSGPDEEVVLDTFRKQVSGESDVTNADGSIMSEIGNTGHGTYLPGDIAKTAEELKLMDNPPCTITNPGDCLLDNPNNPSNPSYAPGIAQMLSQLWVKTRDLDQCLPGPDKGWEGRVDNEEELVSRPLVQGDTDSSEQKQRAANAVINELKFAVGAFKDWVNTKMIGSLPDAITYMDAINKIDDLPTQASQLSDAKQTKFQALARLKSIETSLNSLGDTQPATGSTGEKLLLSLKNQYDAIQVDISSDITIENTKAQLATLNDQLTALQDPIDPTKGLVPQCTSERAAAGWGPVDTTGKGAAVNPNYKGIPVTITTVVTNAQSSMIQGWLGNTFTGGVNGIFGSLFGSNQVAQSKTLTIPTLGTEIEQFCSLPIIRGYSHGDVVREDSSNGHGQYAIGSPSNYTFRNLDAPNGSVYTNGKVTLDYTGVPLVNAEHVYGDISCTGTCSLFGSGTGTTDNTVSIDVNCGSIFKANQTDYTHAGDITF